MSDAETSRNADIRRGGRARTVGETAARLTRPLFQRRGLADGALARDWHLIVGEMLAKASWPEKIAFPKGQRTGGTLHLKLAHGSLALELQHLEPLVLERVNGYFGYAAVSRIRMVQGPLPAPLEERPSRYHEPPELSTEDEDTLRRRTAEVADPELRQALERLGRAVGRRRLSGGDSESN